MVGCKGPRDLVGTGNGRQVQATLAWAFGLRFPLRFFFFLRLRCASCAAAVATFAS